jgi:hypothetical protein
MDEKILGCNEVDELYTDYVEGILEPCEMALCDHHFEICEPCRANLVLIQGIVSSLSQMKEEEVPCSFAEEVMRSLPETCNEIQTSLFGKWIFSMRKSLVLVPLLVCFIIGGYFALSSSVPPLPDRLAALKGSAQRLANSMILAEGSVILDGLKVVCNGSPISVTSGQVIEHYPGSVPAKLSLGDGSIILLSRRAVVSVDGDKLVLSNGRLDLSMAPSGVGFVVKTPHADVIVRGTVYSVEVGAATRVSVVTGSVAVESRLGGESVLLQKGDKVSVLSSGKLLKIMDNDAPLEPVIPTVFPSDEAENTNIGIGDSD